MLPLVQSIVTELRQSLEALYSERLVRIVIFGSQARGDAEAGSDIDVLVVLQGPLSPGQEISRTGKTLAALSLKHDRVVSCTFISEKNYITERSPFLRNVQREGLAV